MSPNQNYTPDHVIHPGASLLETIDDRRVSQKELAVRTGLTTKTINQIIKGKAPITPETAIKLEAVLGVPASLWNNLEKQYQEDIARIEWNEKLEAEEKLAAKFDCYSEIASLGLVKSTSSKRERTEELLRFFGVASLAHVKQLPAVAFRRDKSRRPSEECLAAWLRCGELLAAQVNTAKFSKPAVRQMLGRLRRLTKIAPAEFGKEIVRLCSENGIAVVYLPHFRNTYAHGATRWVNDRPVVQLSLRYKYSDIFWFSLFHELGHVILHGKKGTFIEFDGGRSKTGTEKEADRFASDLLIDRAAYQNLISREGSISANTIKKFAEEQGVAEGIVAGRLAHDGLIPWPQATAFRHQLVFASTA